MNYFSWLAKLHPVVVHTPRLLVANESVFWLPAMNHRFTFTVREAKLCGHCGGGGGGGGAVTYQQQLISNYLFLLDLK